MNPTDPTAGRRPRALRVFASALCAACVTGTAPTASRAIEHEDVFYQLGVAVGHSLAEFQLSAEELAVVQKGLLDVIEGKAVPERTEAQMKQLGEIRNARVAKQSAAYLDEVGKTPGAQVQDSGLIYFEVEAGSGASPSASDTVKVHYHGTLPNGAVFDSSVQRGEPAEFPLNRVIGCWTEGVGMMKLGGKARLVCPPNIAYGARGAPPTIPGGAVLVFEVELLDIKAAPPVVPAESTQ